MFSFLCILFLFVFSALEKIQQTQNSSFPLQQNNQLNRTERGFRRVSEAFEAAISTRNVIGICLERFLKTSFNSIVVCGANSSNQTRTIMRQANQSIGAPHLCANPRGKGKTHRCSFIYTYMQVWSSGSLHNNSLLFLKSDLIEYSVIFPLFNI